MANDNVYESIALLDLSATFAQHWFGSAKNFDAALDGTLTAIDRVDRSVGHTVICLDAPPYFRKDMYAGYKASRPPAEPLQLQCKRAVRHRLEERGYRLARAEGYEADDIIATLAAVYRLVCDDVRIIGSDKDLLQLVNGKVRLFKPAMGDVPETYVDGAECFRKTGVAPAQIVDWLSLQGDKSDDVPGVPGVGPKKATGLIAAYGTLDKLFATVEARPVEVRETFGKAVLFSLQEQEHKDAAFKARELIALRCNAPVDANDLLRKGERKPVAVVYTAPVPGDDEASFDEALDSFTPPSGEQATAPAEQATAPVYPNPSGKPEAELLDPAAAMPAPSAEVKTLSPAALKTVVAAAHEQQSHAAQVVGNDVGPSGTPNVSMVVRESDSSTALAPRKRGAEWDMALEPRGMQQAKWVAETLAPMFPKLGGWPGCLAIIMLGRELGLGVMASLMNFDMVEDRPSPKWQIVAAFAIQHPDCEYFRMVESTDAHATFETKRRQNDKPDRLTFSVAQAKAAGLAKPFSGWAKFPAAMCRKMCAVHLARAVYPDSKASGLYCPEELAA